MKVPNQLIQKYNTPAPRYTSYPPANFFKEEHLTQENIFKILEDSNYWQPRHIAFYIHIPFCKKICHYCGCHAIKLNKTTDIKAYFNALKTEINMVCDHLDKNRLVSQIHYGGGTPNIIENEYIKEINELIFSKFNTIEKPEIAIECNPAYLDYKYIDNLLNAGFNRFSLGIQDFDNQVLNNVNRETSALPLIDIIKYLKNKNPEIGVNLDFIYGLPGQTTESFKETIQKAIELRADRLVTFSYAHVPWQKKHQAILEKKGLPNSEQKMSMFLNAYTLLKNSGYKPIGFDHYVLPHDELHKALEKKELHRNFQGYCTRQTTGQVYAFGVSAISQLEKAYLQITKNMHEYINELKNKNLPVKKYYKLNKNELITGNIITYLLCNKYINFNEQMLKFGITSEELFKIIRFDKDTFYKFFMDNLLIYNDNEITITELGNIFIRNIAASLDTLYKCENQMYSKTV